MVIKVPLPGLGLVDVEDPQLVKDPATSTTPMIFASLLGGVRLKSLLQFTSGNGIGCGSMGTLTFTPLAMNTEPRLFLR
jgi:hypothetical protein